MPELGKVPSDLGRDPTGPLPRHSSRNRSPPRCADEVSSDTYIAELSPAMDVLCSVRKASSAFCTTLDLLELQRQVQASASETGVRTRVRPQGKAVAAVPDRCVLPVSGEPVAESPLAVALSSGHPRRHGCRNGEGLDVLAGWHPARPWLTSPSSSCGGSICGGARTALGLLAFGAGGDCCSRSPVGYVLVRRMLAALELEERFRTAGRIGGITRPWHRLHLAQIEHAQNVTPAHPRVARLGGRHAAPLRDRLLRSHARGQAPGLPSIESHTSPTRAGRGSGYASEANAPWNCAGPLGALGQGDRYLLERAALT